jgi:crotonobetainyl-CoA:carnitine CoA-transferase CaiB-like acyl-CoA transferase
MSATPTSGALAGLTVLDLSRLLPGPYLGRVLADLGADVIKVEAPGGHGDWVRWLPPLAGDQGASFAALNYGKRSVVLDLKKPEGAAVLRALCRRADVLVESFRPGVLDRLGVGYDALAAENPRLVFCSISGYGQEGPLAATPGHDLGYLARSGVLSLFGPAASAPQVPGVQLADIAGGALSAAVGILAALRERDRTGKGRHLDVSMTRSLGAFLALELPRRAAGEVDARGEGLLTGGVPCYRVYATADGRHMVLAALEPKFWTSFCERAGCRHLVDQALARGEVGGAVVRELTALFASRTQAEWIAVFAGSETCCEPVLTPEEAIASGAIAAVEAAGALAPATDVGFGPVASSRRTVPRLGEDGLAVARELGVSDQVVAAAREAGALLVPGEEG